VSSAAPLSKRATVLGRIGGSVARGERFSLELVVFRDGLIEAALSDEDGHAFDEPAEVSIELGTRVGERARVPLVYAPQRQRFQGQADASIELESGPFDVDIAHDGRRTHIHREHVIALRGPELGGHMLALAKFGLELWPEASGRVRALVRDARGELVRDAKLAFEARLLTTSLARENVRLTWSEASDCYEGHASAPLRPGPLEVALSSADSDVARIRQAALAPAPTRAGRVVLVGFHSVEVVATQGELELFVYDAFGKRYPANHLELVVLLRTKPNVTLSRASWDAQRESYRVKLAAADVATVPFRISLRAGERIDWGGAATLR
jgi:hypothetical protein